jgi:DNA-binding winged helix-turn-helix (wHTH) protein/tetratricopeptide (TPR) repeat protein
MPTERFEFGPFLLEPAERRLTAGSRHVSLTPKAFDLLLLLVEGAGRLIRKQDLLDRLWPGVFVEEVNLAQNVSALRKALGGDGRESYIQTVAGVGYRFVAPVRTSDPRPTAVDAARKRLIVLPFRMLKADPELDFLAYSLPDALTAELSAFTSLIVRSSLIAAKFAGDAPDLPRIARDAQVDFVVSGTVLRAGDEVRVSAQLSDAMLGTVMWSHSVQASVGDLFRLQDSLVARIAGSLARPLTSREAGASRQDVPASGISYDLFLRANEVSRQVTAVKFDDAARARDLYLESLREDPNYAPAWARLARIYRLLGKYVAQDAAENLARADDAIQRALAINPELAVAINWAAQFEVDRGQAPQAMTRLLDLLRRQGPHPEVFTALVHACRFAGLLDASAAAHDQAQRLDAAADTGVMHTYFLQQRFPEAIVASGNRKGYVWGLSLSAVGRGDEAIRTLKDQQAVLVLAVHALLIDDRMGALQAIRTAAATAADPEARFYAARFLARLGDRDEALDLLAQSVAGGYACAEALETDPWLDAVRSTATFQDTERRAREMRATAQRAFDSAHGEALLGMR